MQGREVPYGGIQHEGRENSPTSQETSDPRMPLGFRECASQDVDQEKVELLKKDPPYDRKFYNYG